MAIKKVTELESGVIAEYIKIKGIQKSHDLDRGDEVLASIEIYIDETARTEGKSPVTTYGVSIPLVNSFEEAYTELKKIVGYEDTTDIL